MGGEARDFSLQSVALVDPDVMKRKELRACELTLEFPFAAADPELEQIYPGITNGLDLIRAKGSRRRPSPPRGCSVSRSRTWPAG